MGGTCRCEEYKLMIQNLVFTGIYEYWFSIIKIFSGRNIEPVFFLLSYGITKI